jgi:hypothetical protein
MERIRIHQTALAAAICAGVAVAPLSQAGAVPSFGEQTGQPCAACHVGAFGPQLKPFARDFKLYAYTATDGKTHGPPIAVTIQASYTRTNGDQPGGAARWFAPNDNPAFDQGSIYLAGRLTPHLGAFAQVTYDGVARTLSLDNTDIRYAKDGNLWGHDLVWGVTANNSPTLEDLWNSTPAWGFPYNSSKLAPTPLAATLMDGALAHNVAGAGAYTLWDDTVYLHAALYGGLSRDTRNTIGEVPVSGTDTVVGPIPYWRLALQRGFDNDRQNIQIGTYGLHASVYPAGNGSAGRTDSFTDIAFDTNYQWIADPKSVVSDMISAHATWIHEDQRLSASSALANVNRGGNLDTVRADLSYSLGATWTPTVQYFQTAGAANSLYFGLPSPVPNSAGFIGELAYVPWGKPESRFQSGNIRVALQYVAYTQFNGSSNRASDNNAWFLSFWSAFRF